MTDSYIFKTPLGWLEIGEEHDKITNIHLLPNKSDCLQMRRTKIHSDLLHETYTQLNEYFAGKRMQFDLPLYYLGTPFQMQVWKELRKIPYGQTRCYEDIAVAVGNHRAVRAVGQANNKNPIMIVIPCHRVIHKNGNIEGFSYGTEVKKYLLDLEKNYTV